MSACEGAAAEKRRYPEGEIPGQTTCKRSEADVSKSEPGGHSPMAPPGPIPNPEVKHWRVDDSRTLGPAKVDRRQEQYDPQVGSLRVVLFSAGLY